MVTFPTLFLYAMLLHLINHSSTGQNFRPSDWVIGSSAIHQGGPCQRKVECGYIWFGVFGGGFFMIASNLALSPVPSTTGYCFCFCVLLRRNGVAIIVNKRVRNAVRGCNLKNNRMISVHFQGKPFNITVIQGSAPTSDTKEAEVEQFYETYKTF